MKELCNTHYRRIRANPRQKKSVNGTGINVETGSADGDDQNWNDCRSDAPDDHSLSETDDVGFIAKLTQWVESHFEVDPATMYATS